MNMRACDFEERLPTYLAEGLSRTETDDVEQHVTDCDRCKETLERLATPEAFGRWRHHRGACTRDLPPPAFLSQLHALDTLFHSKPRSARALVAPPTIAGYDIDRELGRGGMGVVYLANERRLGRNVALKMILAGAHATEKELDAFRAEAAVVAKLEHPHIIRIHAVGDHDGLPYLSLEHMSGGSLARKLANLPQPARTAAELTETLARTVAFAHDRGIVHRDLKPSNVLLAHDGTPKISDFGLAKRLEDGRTGVTASGVVGTPNYMAPEQVAGNQPVGAAADVYALGAILYEMLCGHPPFQGETSFDTLLQVSHQEPVPPRRLRPSVDRDLETICLKCLEKSPANRYGSALALADDLARFLAGKPTLARPAGPLQRTAKWSRRNPGVASLLSAVVVLTVVGFALVTWLWNRAEANARLERSTRLASDRLAADVRIDQAQAMCLKGDVGEGLLAYAHALEIADRCGDADLERVARINLAAWPSRFVRQRHAFPHQAQVRVAEYSPDGTRILTGSADGLVKVWNPDSGDESMPSLTHDTGVLAAAFSPDGTSILVGCDSVGESTGTAYLWDLATRQARRLPHPSRVKSVAFDPTGKTFLTVCATEAQVWDMATGQRVGEPMRHDGHTITAARFSPDGNLVITGGDDHEARLWHSATGRSVGKPLAHAGAGAVRAVAFRPDGCAVVTGGDDGIARIWDIANGTAIGKALSNRGPIQCCAFSPDGSLLAVGCRLSQGGTENRRPTEIGGEVKVWRANRSYLLSTLYHPLAVTALAFSPDSRLLLTGSVDNRVRLFEANSGSLIGKPLLQEDRVATVAFHPRTGRNALTGCSGDRSGVARLWDIPQPTDGGPALDIERRASIVLFLPDRRDLLIAADQKPGVYLVDPATRCVAPPMFANESFLSVHDVSVDGKWLFGADDKKNGRVFRLDTKTLHRSYPHDDQVAAGSFSPSAKTFWTVSRDRRISHWDRDSGRKLDCDVSLAGRLIRLKAYSDDEVAWMEGDDASLRFCTYSVAQGRTEVWSQPGHAMSGRIEADWNRVVTADWNSGAHLRDGKTGKILGTPFVNGEERIISMTPSRDRRLLATCGWDKTARVWDLATGKLLGPPIPHIDTLFDVAFDADATHAASAGEGFGSQLWKLPTPIVGTAAEELRRVEALTGLR
jgi:eukaryotic-like serine/threonine-protein kinase